MRKENVSQISFHPAANLWVPIKLPLQLPTYIDISKIMQDRIVCNSILYHVDSSMYPIKLLLQPPPDWHKDDARPSRTGRNLRCGLNFYSKRSSMLSIHGNRRGQL